MGRSRLIIAWTTTFLCCLFSARAGYLYGDVLELSGGGRIEGRVISQPQDKEGNYVVEVAAGGRLTIPRSQVTRVRTTSNLDDEYEKKARSSPDTVEAHWKLVEWCRERRLTSLAQRHLERILELDPNHEPARTALGFRRQHGQWMQREDVMASRGMVLYEGRYVTPQHVELLERQKETRTASAGWAGTLDRLRRALVGRREDRARDALAEVQKINDPLAAEAVVGMLRREQDLELKRLWIEVAARLDHQLAVNALVDLSLTDPDPEIRHECLERLIEARRPGLVSPYVRALKDRDNDIINRAAGALGQIGDRTAIPALIEALVTKHRVKVSEGNPDQHAYSFSPQGGNAFSFGGGGPKFVTVDVNNPAVLDALVRLAGGVSFDYDQEQWRRWLAAQTKLQVVDVRRDQ